MKFDLEEFETDRREALDISTQLVEMTGNGQVAISSMLTIIESDLAALVKILAAGVNREDERGSGVLREDEDGGEIYGKSDIG